MGTFYDAFKEVAKGISPLIIVASVALPLTGRMLYPSEQPDSTSEVRVANAPESFVYSSRGKNTHLWAWDNDGDGSLDEGLIVRKYATGVFRSIPGKMFLENHPKSDWAHLLVEGANPSEQYMRTTNTQVMSKELSHSLSLVNDYLSDTK
jgi:hypothetical protein